MKKKFTIILLHYNQKQYIYEAIDSVLCQDYDDIEFIINDDCSKDFDEKEVRKYIEKKAKKNIKLIIHKNKKNVGIVKSINECIKLSSGEYISFFAADDALNNNSVISNYVKRFDCEPSVDVWCFQCLMYDKKMENIYYKFISEEKGEIINSLSQKKLFSMISLGCIFAAGATAFKRSVLINKPFDEEYSVIEDWPYYISLARENYKIKYYNYIALNHRDGGVSHSETSPILKKYRNDLVQVYKKEIFPYFKKIHFFDKMKILNNYKLLTKTVSTEKYEPKSNVNYKINTLIYLLINKIQNVTYKIYNLYNYLYILIPCLLIYIIYDCDLLIKLFLWFISVPIGLFICFNIGYQVLSKLYTKINYGSNDSEQRR